MSENGCSNCKFPLKVLQKESSLALSLVLFTKSKRQVMLWFIKLCSRIIKSSCWVSWLAHYSLWSLGDCLVISPLYTMYIWWNIKIKLKEKHWFWSKTLCVALNIVCRYLALHILYKHNYYDISGRPPAPLLVVLQSQSHTGGGREMVEQRWTGTAVIKEKCGTLMGLDWPPKVCFHWLVRSQTDRPVGQGRQTY